MAPPKASLKILDLCRVGVAPPSATHFSLPLTHFDLLWLRFHPVERLFFYSLPQSHPSFFYDSLIPKLRSSLSLTLHHFLPLAGKIVWPSDSQKPIIQYTPGDGVSLVIAESDADFNLFLDNSPSEAIQSRPLVPNLDSSDSLAQCISLQVTLFPNVGFCIGISAHHAVLDGKSTTMFMKAWAYLCQTGGESSSLLPELRPLLDREVIKDTKGLDMLQINQWVAAAARFDPAHKDKHSLKVLSNIPPILDHSARATFELSRQDLERIRNRILSVWDKVDGEQSVPSKPSTLSTFVVTCAYVSVCIAKAINGAERDRNKFAFGFSVDCRSRLEPAVPENYFGNCVSGHIVDTQPEDYTREDGVVIVAKKIYSKIKMLEKGVLEGAETIISRFFNFAVEGVDGIGVAGSTRFGVYRTDFGWGRPAKVEITSVDRGSTIGMAESKDGKGGVEVGLVLNKHAMDLFATLFHKGLEP